jgi:hypothetical protein
MEKEFLSKWTLKNTGVVINISDKTDFKISYNIFIKVMIHQEKITVINIHASNLGSINFIKQILLDVQALIYPTK